MSDEGRGRPSRSSLCVCCGVRTDYGITFPRSSPRPDLADFEVPICAECRQLVGRRRFKSVAAMGRYVRYLLSLKRPPFNVPTAEELATLPDRLRRAAQRLIRPMVHANARRKRQISYNPKLGGGQPIR
jgi:hypothetical protein